MKESEGTGQREGEARGETEVKRLTWPEKADERQKREGCVVDPETRKKAARRRERHKGRIRERWERGEAEGERLSFGRWSISG